MKLLQRFLGADRRSASTAKERLQLVLVHDRADLSPGKLNAIKDEVVEVISRYVEIDHQGVSVALTRDRNEQRLVADIPLAAERRRRK